MKGYQAGNLLLSLDLYFTYKIAEFDPQWLERGFIGSRGSQLVNGRQDDKFPLCENVRKFICGRHDAPGNTT